MDGEGKGISDCWGWLLRWRVVLSPAGSSMAVVVLMTDFSRRLSSVLKTDLQAETKVELSWPRDHHRFCGVRVEMGVRGYR